MKSDFISAMWDWRQRQLTFLYVHICVCGSGFAYTVMPKWLQKDSKWRSATKPDQPKVLARKKMLNIVLAKMQKGLREGQEYGKEKENIISYH